MCDHREIIVVSGLKYCKKCNKYMGEQNAIDPSFKPFFDALNKNENYRSVLEEIREIQKNTIDNNAEKIIDEISEGQQ